MLTRLGSGSTRRVVYSSRLFPEPELSMTSGEIKSKNSHLLESLGMIKRVEHGLFAFLPPFIKSLNKLKRIVENELEAVGAHQVLLPTLVPQAWWHDSKRLDRNPNAFNDLYQLKDRRMQVLFLAPTHEETITKLVAIYKRTLAERRLPLMLFQTTSKFRDEARPKHGLMRTNEFIMNDLYSFDADLQCAEATYKCVSGAYDRIFKKIGLNCLKTNGDSGSIGGSYSHEYQLPLSIGEDKTVICNNCDTKYNSEMHKQKCLNCGSDDTQEVNTCEVGHTFLLGTIYSKVLDASYLSRDTKTQIPLQMGCYGLGLTRIIAAGIELLSSNTKIVWPNNIAPYEIAIVMSKKGSKNCPKELVETHTENILKYLLDSATCDIIVHDKENVNVRKKILDMQALGVPNIIVVGGHKFNQEVPLYELNYVDELRKPQVEWHSIDQLKSFMNLRFSSS